MTIYIYQYLHSYLINTVHIGLYTETTNYFRTTSENYNKHKEDLVKKLDVDFKL